MGQTRNLYLREERETTESAASVGYRNNRFLETIPLQGQLRHQLLQLYVLSLELVTSCWVASLNVSRASLSFPASMNFLVHA